MHALIVGQAPSRTSREPLDGPAGRRLERLAGIREGELTWWFTVGNLLPEWPGNRPRRPGPHSAAGDEFDLERARRAWEGVAREFLLEGQFDLVLLLGGNVAAAAGLRSLPTFEWVPMFREGASGWRYGYRSADHLPAPEWACCRVAVVPHPSGASHFWNDPENWERAASFMRGVVEGLAA